MRARSAYTGSCRSGYADSGLHGDAEQVDGGPVPLCRAPLAESAAALAAILVEEDADVLVTYDPNGGYGHPDHVRVHELGVRAAEIAGTPRVFEATVPRDLLLRGDPARARRSTASRRSSTRRRSSARSPRAPTSRTASTYVAYLDAEARVDGRARVAGHRRRRRPHARGVPAHAARRSTAACSGTEWYVERSRPTARG